MSNGAAQARSLVDAARRTYAHDPAVRAQLDDCARRLEQPLRVALAGSLKAGKSTLLNALVGQDIAPTDATECTRVVTWYRNGSTPSVTAWHGDRHFNVPVQRIDGGLTFDMGALTAAEVDRLDVEWPARTLIDTTVIDTPGTSSLSRDVSERTLRFLTPDNAASAADAVVYLLRNLSAADTQFLGQIGSHVGAESGPLGVVGVVSRADEIGAGRIDAMLSAKEIAQRFAGELERTGLCQAVVPVAGLLAFAARTLREVEFSAFVQLAQVPMEDLQLALLSADRFARPDVRLPVDPALRAELVRRFGLFGIRLAVTLVRLGARDSTTLANELVERSGLRELRELIDVQFGQRAEQLKTHSALVALERALSGRPERAASDILAQASRLLNDVHGFAELRLLGRLRTTDLLLPEDAAAELHRLIGGFGVAPHVRLGLSPGVDRSEVSRAAVSAVRTWRTRANHPLLDRFTSRACETAARSAEGILESVHAR
ncbi:Isoniazid-inducible protein iniC [Skermania sp. ID1734]|uniref:dynamin family protein n=1 Tax=Skermania sp. ID1734 TaxID=2597516 RepID=UPI0011817699|nr:dynamin family protein [Skermania sp. ID1734]TSE00463.1 Isoniazid-inducible protein iniC [Skermania sp. ID1734]